MATFQLFYTNGALNLLAASVAGGGAVSITGVQVGSGFPAPSDNPQAFTGLKTWVKTLGAITGPSTLSGVTSVNTLVSYQDTVRWQLSTQDAPSVFNLNEYGIFAKVGAGSPVLIAYCTTGANVGDTITPSGSSTPVIKQNATVISYSQSTSSTTALTLNSVVDLHAVSHLDNGIDPIPVATTSRTGSLTRLSGIAGQYLDGAAGTWVQVIPSGVIWDFGGSSAPTGWLLCDGSAISRTTYSALFGVLGTAYGIGNGSTTFNVPDFRGRVSIGAGAGVNLTSRSIGDSGGEENHLLTTTEMPTHAHGITDPGHSHAITDSGHVHSITDPGHVHSITDGGHSHSVSDPHHSHHVTIWGEYGAAPNTVIGGTPSNVLNQLNPGGAPRTDNSTPAGNAADYAATGITLTAAATGIGIANHTTGITISSHVTSVTINSGTTGVSTTNQGGGASHNNLQPYLVATRIVKI